MSHYIHSHPNTDFMHHPHNLSARHRYLAAMAQAKAAEAEYLAAEEAEQEEAALRRRLHDIQLRKQYVQPFSPSYPYQSIASNDHPYQDNYTVGYELLELQRQIEQEELRRRMIEERLQARHMVEEKAHLQALPSAHKVESAHRAHVERQSEAERAIVALNYQAVQGQAVRRRGQQYAHHPQSDVRRSQGACHLHHQCHCSEKAIEAPFNPFLNAILGRDRLAPVSPTQLQQNTSAEVFDANQFLGRTSKAHRGSRDRSGSIDEIIKGLFRLNQERQQATLPVPQVQPPSAEDILKRFLTADFAVNGRRATVPRQSASDSNNQETNVLEQILGLFSDGRQYIPEAPRPQQASSSASPTTNPNPEPAMVSQPDVEDFTKIFNVIFGPTAFQVQQQKVTPSNTSATPGTSKLDATSIEASLKAGLEDRLGNEYASEVRDTIQAILASLQDTPSTGVPPASSASSPPNAASSSKGKAKAAEPVSLPIPSNAGATSQDVSKAVDEVRSIEATFYLLQSEFAFPSQLDFLAPTQTSEAEPVPSSLTHLSYTSRNNPVRHYEQSLGALMSQLDAVGSFGNDALRAMRKDVVGRVERALEELESEVEGRWKANLAKGVKSAECVVAEEKTVPTSSTPESTLTERQDTTPEVLASHTKATSPALESDQSLEAVVPETTKAIKVAQDTPTEPAVETKQDIPTPPVDTTSEELTDQPDEETITGATSSSGSPTVPVLLDASVTTIKPYDVDPVGTDEVDTFLLPAVTATPSSEAKLEARDNNIGDTGSDWSEVEA